eukprot:TRINITY_DN3510_c0_g1_i6.p1 TRINITY_DN3510_c0_g1~~TRINITY_DN3510_c0_g1_i6.p1  ORF type:complete len:718 (+),score=180.76 TRINITY_DN3510_c0_g1_i6:83-2236(+)
MHVNCSGRGIVELNLDSIFHTGAGASEEERSALAGVKSLDLSQNELFQITGLQPFSNLTSLDLSHNRLTGLQLLPLGLVRLKVAANRLTTLEGLSSLHSLQELDVSRNKLAELTGLPRSAPLTVLKLGHNRLPGAQGLEGFVTLQRLDLEHNYICLTDDLRPLQQCTELRTLNLRGNPCADHPSYRGSAAYLIPSLASIDGSPPPARRNSSPTAAHARGGSGRPVSPLGNGGRSRSAPRRRAGDISTADGPLFSARNTSRARPPGASAVSSSLGQPAALDSRGAAGTPRLRHALAASPSGGSRRPGAVSSPRGRGGPARTAHGARFSAGAGGADADGAARAVDHTADLPLSESDLRGPGAAGPRTDSPRAAPCGGGAPANASAMSFGGVKHRSEARRGEAAAGRKGEQLEAAELRRLLEDEHRSSALLERQKRKLEAELSDVRRVLADELAKLSDLREANLELEREAVHQRHRAEKLAREYKYAHNSLIEERRRRQEEVAKLRTAHQAALQAVRTQGQLDSSALGGRPRMNTRDAASLWAEERARLTERLREVEDHNRVLAAALLQQRAAVAGVSPPRTVRSPPAERGPRRSSPQGRAAPAAPAGRHSDPAPPPPELELAVSLKQWLLREMQQGGQGQPAAAGEPQRSERHEGAALRGPPGPPGGGASQPALRPEDPSVRRHSASQQSGSERAEAGDVQQMWSQNLSILQDGAERHA